MILKELNNAVILNLQSTLTYEVNSLTDKIYRNFQTKTYLFGLSVQKGQIQDILVNYLIGLEKGKIPQFSSKKGSDAKKVVEYIVSNTGYNKEVVYFVLYELEALAVEGNLVAQKILRYNLTKSDGEVAKEIFKPKPFIELPEFKFADLSKSLLYVLLILLVIYFAPFVSEILKQISGKEK